MAELRRLSIVTVLMCLLVACGGGDDPIAEPDSSSTEDTAAESAGGDDSSDGEGATDDSGEFTDDDPTGTITVGGETFEVIGPMQRFTPDGMEDAGGDFEFCTYEDGGEAGNLTLGVLFAPERYFYIAVVPGEEGFVSSRLATAALGSGEDASDVQWDFDGSTLSGTSVFPEAGALDYEIAC